MASLFLGVDCGTGKVALAVIDAAGNQQYVASRPHDADLPAPAGHHEQDAGRIIATAERLVREIPIELRRDVAGIGFTGQMHGVVLHDAGGRPRSALVTWRDRRMALDPVTNRSFAMAVLAGWASRNPLASSVRAATIHGLLAFRWGALVHSPIDPTDAQAWGGLEPCKGTVAGQLPVLVDHGSIVGCLSGAAASSMGLSGAIPLVAPLGDNQASIRATLAGSLHELALTMGTGCQLAALVPRSQHLDLGRAERRPYDAHFDLVAAVPLCGGAAWRWLADAAMSWVVDLGLPALSHDEMFTRLDELGLAATDELSFSPHLMGERYNATLHGELSGLRTGNGSLGQIARAVARGISANARDLLPPGIREGYTRVVGSGNALRRSALLRAMAEQELGLPLVLSERREEAATGAALVAASTLVSERSQIPLCPRQAMPH